MVYPSDQDGGIDLVEIATTLWRGRWLVAMVTFGIVAISMAYAFLAAPVYRAEALLIPNEQEAGQALPAGMTGLASLAGFNIGATGDTTEVVATLSSRVFIEEFILEENLLPVLFASDWDAANKRWKGDDQDDWPDIREGVEFFIEEVRSVNEDATTGLVTLAIEWTDANLVAEWTEKLVARVNDRLRARDLRNSEQRLEYLNAEFEKANLVELRLAISRLIETEMQTIMLAQAESEYAFKIIDPPRVPHEPVAPKPLLIAVLSVLFGGLIGMFVVLFRAAAKTRPAAEASR